MRVLFSWQHVCFPSPKYYILRKTIQKDALCGHSCSLIGRLNNNTKPCAILHLSSHRGKEAKEESLASVFNFTALHFILCGNEHNIFGLEFCVWFNSLIKMCPKCFAKSDWNCMNPSHLKNTTFQLAKNLTSPFVYRDKTNKGIFSFCFSKADLIWDSLFYFSHHIYITDITYFMNIKSTIATI